MTKTNRKYKNPSMQKVYDVCVALFEDKDSELYTEDGEPRRGALQRIAFWDGYEGKHPVPHAKATLAWACYMAGKDVRAAECKHNAGTYEDYACRYVYLTFCCKCGAVVDSRSD